MNTLIEELRVYYQNYNEYKNIFSISQIQEYRYYLDESIDGIELEENSPIVQEWRDRYHFLVSNSLDIFYYDTVQFICKYIKPFTTSIGQVVSFLQDNGDISKRNMKLHFFIHQEDEKIDYKKIYIQYQAINEVLTLKEQEGIYALRDIPKFSDVVEGTVVNV